jgi:predicted CopG family antitoxin
VAPSELAQLKEEDNMSISDIIRQRFKKEEHIIEVKTPQDVAQIIIKNPDDANLVQNVEGDERSQLKFQSKIQDIETNKMDTWTDLA